LFIQEKSLKEARNYCEQNLIQIGDYLVEYCKNAPQEWCDEQIQEFEGKLLDF